MLRRGKYYVEFLRVPLPTVLNKSFKRHSDDGGRSGDFETELLLLAGGRMGEDKEGYGMGDAAFP